MKILFQPDNKFNGDLSKLPKDRLFKMKAVPRVGEKVAIGGVFYKIVDVLYDGNDGSFIICYFI